MPRVLVVDDEPKIQAFLKEALSRKGIAVAAVATGEEAIEHLANEPPDVVLLDLRLPGMTGIDVLKRVSELCPEAKVVMLTGLDSSEAEAEAKAYGAFGYVTKPFDFTDAIWSRLFPDLF